MSRPEVLVIGGGIQGCSTALHLAMRGIKAAVIEKNYCGRHASGVNAGGAHRLGRFPSELPLSALTMELWHSMESLVDEDCGFRPVGRLKVAETGAEMEYLEERWLSVRNAGYDYEEKVDRAGLRELEPNLAHHCVGGLFDPTGGYALPYRTVAAFQRKARALGAVFHEGTRVLCVQRQDGLWRVDTDKGRFEAPKLVNCAGAWADRITAAMGEPVPMEIIAPMLMVTARMPRLLHTVSSTADRILSIKQFENGTIVVGGGYRGIADRDAETTELNFTKLGYNARLATELFPALKGAKVVRSWAGIEARMPDAMPVIGPSLTEEGAWHAFGFSAHGFHLGPAVGRVMAELVATGRSNVPVAAFSIGRFTGAG